jgi:hypothetical protein
MTPMPTNSDDTISVSRDGLQALCDQVRLIATVSCRTDFGRGYRDAGRDILGNLRRRGLLLTPTGRIAKPKAQG